MKKTIHIVAALGCVTLLALGSFPTAEYAGKVSAAQDEAIAEAEPNDDPLSAQEIPFPGPGETVTVQGAVGPDDDGSFSEELETFFSFAGGIGVIHDWYVLDPDALAKQDMAEGPIPVRVSVGWDGETDVDVWIGTLVDDFLFFFDGFKLLSDVQTASLNNPETWPNLDASGTGENLAFYLQPQGVTDADGNPIANDGFGRKLVIGVSHFDGPPANYTLTVENGGTVVAKQDGGASEQHQLDDGGITATWFSGPSDGIVLNRYRVPKRGSEDTVLTSISHPFIFFSAGGDPTGQPIRALVLAGDSDDPTAEPPSLAMAKQNGAVLFDEVVTIPGTISSQADSRFIGRLNEIPINVVIPSDVPVVYVGLQWPSAPFEETGVTLAFDTSPVQYLRTYLSTDLGETWGRPFRTEDLSGEDVFTNADIRGTFTIGKVVAGIAKSKTNAAHGKVVSATLSRQQIGIKPVSR